LCAGWIGSALCLAWRVVATISCNCFVIFCVSTNRDILFPELACRTQGERTRARVWARP
jgi:hypothetical protein